MVRKWLSWRGWMCCLLLLAMVSPSWAQEAPGREQADKPRTVGEYLSQSLGTGQQQIAPETIEPDNYVVAPTLVEEALIAPAAQMPWKPSDAELNEHSNLFFEKLQEICFVLAFICFLIWVVLQALNKVAPGVFRQKGRLLNVLERQALAPGKSICAVEVAGKILIIGMSESGMNTLCELSQEEYEKATQLDEPEQPIELQAVAGGTPEVTRDPKDTYGSILKHYLTIIPGVGGKNEN